MQRHHHVFTDIITRASALEPIKTAVYYTSVRVPAMTWPSLVASSFA